MAKHSFNTLMRRMSHAGFNKQWVTTALLPDWWEESNSRDPSLLTEIEIRVARFLALPLSKVRDSDQPLTVPSYGSAQLRRVRDVNRDRLGPAIHTAMQVGGAVVRNLRNTGLIRIPPADPLKWRQLLQPSLGSPVHLNTILSDLWNSGIPVVQLDTLPSPSFQGLACFVDRHPVICLGHRHDEPGRVAFLIAHEIGHIVAGDCSPNALVLHEIDGGHDDSDMECNADQFAALLLVGNAEVPFPEEEKPDAKSLAQAAFNLEVKTGADASSIIYAWAARTLDYATAAMAVKALYRSTGALRQVRLLLEEHVELDAAGESDRELLRCVYGDPASSTVAA